MEQIKFPEFIELNIIWDDPKDSEKHRSGWKMKLNPMTVHYYYKVINIVDGKEKELTLVGTTGGNFPVDMPYEEFDEFWSEIKRSFNVETPLY